MMLPSLPRAVIYPPRKQESSGDEFVAKVRSRRLVIDASIARAAGDSSTHPTSRNCRDFLLIVLEICHRAVMTAPILEEWNRHQSRFASTWRKSMMARKKLEVLKP